MKLKQIHAEVWLGGILIILAVIFYIMAGQFPNASAAVWPKTVLIGIMILSALLVIHGLQRSFFPWEWLLWDRETGRRFWE